MISFNSQMVRLLNQMAILRTIQMSDGISRQQIARTTGISNSTISTLVTELIASGVVRKLDEGQSSGGRKSNRFGINEEGGYILGVDLGSSRMTCGIVDLRANMHEKLSIDAPTESAARLPALIELLQRTRRCGEEKGMNNFLGIGIAVSGSVDTKRGLIVKAANLGWNNVALQKEVEYATGLKTSIDNIAKAGALAELYYGAGNGVENMLYLAIGSGIGAGIITDGSLMTGMRNTAGEIGHMQMVRDGLLCKCGSYGCLETIASGRAIERKAISLRQESELFDTFITRNGGITAEYVFACAKNGDFTAEQIIDEAIENIAMATGNLITAFNPEMVIIGGGLSNAGAYYLERIIEKMESILQRHNNQGLQVKLSSLGSDSGVLGAATLVIQRLFRPIEAKF